MIKSILSKRPVKKQSSNRPAMIEPLEGRQLLSAAPVLHTAAAKLPPLVSLSPATPGKILAGNKPGYETVTVRNLTTAIETESVTITLAPSLDGVNPAGTYSTPSVTQTVTIKKKGSIKIRVPFIPPITLAAGKYKTLATVDVGGTIVNATAPGAYTLTLPPLPTTTPSLIGRFTGLVTATSSQSTGFFGGGTSTTIHQVSIIWQTTAQDLTSLTGIFAVGDQQTAGVMTGYELNNGKVHYTLTSPLITYTMDGTIVNKGGVLKINGLFKGTLVNNIFKTIGGVLHMVEG
jgi:hypothetical protein